MTRRQLLVVLPLVLVAAGAVTLAAQASVEDRAERFIEIATRGHERALALRQIVLDAGVDVSGADSLIASCSASLTAAQAAIEADPPDYETAAAEAKEAAARCREALQILGQPVEGEPLESGQRAQGLLEAITNHRRRLVRLQETLQAIGALGPSPVPAGTQALLDQANGELGAADSEFDAAEGLLDVTAPDVPEATQHITTGLRHLQAAFAALHGAEDWTDMWKAQNFLTPLLRLIESVQSEVEGLTSEGKDVTQVQISLDQARNLYQDAEERLLAGDKKGALELIKEIHKLLSDIRKDISELELAEFLSPALVHLFHEL